MSENAFIRAIEIWVPTADRNRLTLKCGYYGELDYFRRISRGMQFAYGEGLPGKAWAEGHPVVLKNLADSYFKRGDAIMSTDLVCAVAVPEFVGGTLMSVKVFFCGEGAHHIGALELWHAATGEPQMKLEEGYFGNADKFEFTSRHTHFARRTGLPGLVWDSGVPLVMDDLATNPAFVRADAAAKAGINRAVGFPCSVRGPEDWVLTFLSASTSPVVRRCELWLPDADAGMFRFASGYCEAGTDLSAIHANATVPLDAGTLGEARISKATALTTDFAKARCAPSLSAGEAGLQAMIAMPVFSGARFEANLVWYL